MHAYCIKVAGVMRDLWQVDGVEFERVSKDKLTGFPVVFTVGPDDKPRFWPAPEKSVRIFRLTEVSA